MSLSSTRRPDRPLKAFKSWAVTKAFPLWATRGYDAKAHMFEEQLHFDGTPVLTVPRRVMVQARQICVFTLATKNGWYDGHRITVAAGHSLVENFWAKDKRGGWVFSLHRDGTVADGRLDLYAHAFVLFALAGLIELTGDPDFIEAVDKTLDVLDTHFADRRSGGLWDALPRQDALRRQNPHMHLLEAYLALHDATNDDTYLTRAGELVDLAQRRFINRSMGALREYFDDSWSVFPAPGQGCVEPGHLYEWAWLLRRYETKTGIPMETLVHSLLTCALRHGTDRASGRVIDEICEEGRARKTSSRSWPHAEAIKSLAMEYHLGRADHRSEAAAILERLNRVYCPDKLNGGWVDHVCEADAPISGVMPASTLYHLSFALAEADRCFGADAQRKRRSVQPESGDRARTFRAVVPSSIQASSRSSDLGRPQV